MNEQDQLAAVAELDGCTWKAVPPRVRVGLFTKEENDLCEKLHPKRVLCKGELPKFLGFPDANGDWVHVDDYLHSRDVIVPVIEKQPYDVRVRVAEQLFVGSGSFAQILLTGLFATPAQLVEALLRAAGRWVE